MPAEELNGYTPDERILVFMTFKCQVIISHGTVFQGLLWNVLRAKYRDDFATIGLYGPAGDGGNDGYIASKRRYFQLYAPIDSKRKIAEAANKARKDFAKLATKWTSNGGIQHYSFAFNDKYEGAPVGRRTETAKAPRGSLRHKVHAVLLP